MVTQSSSVPQYQTLVTTETSIVSETGTMELTTLTVSSATYYDDVYGDGFDYGDEYTYPGYDFERGLYLYIWEIIVVVIFLVNIVVISVFLRRKMRNATNIILAGIAISDSLTGLVTLPTYIMVFQNFDPVKDDHDHIHSQNYNENYTETTENNTNAFITTPSYSNSIAIGEPIDGYILTKDLCTGFMISKYFLSRSFHTVSIFLTLFLAIQRYVSVAFPYKSQFLFSTKRTMVCCGAIFLFSPLLHMYHLTEEKAIFGVCQWEIQESGCGGTCIYLWIVFFVRHFLPCVTLVVLSVLFISTLRQGEKSLRRMDSNSSQISRRAEENRRISITVTAIVVIFLVPEIPYGIFLLYNAVDKVANDGKGIRLKTNRAIQLAYEVGLVFSFHANFYIYMFFNRRFRKILYRTIVKPVRRVVGDPRRLSITRTSSTSHAGSQRKANDSGCNMQHETRYLHRADTENNTSLDTKTIHTFASEKSQDAVEMEQLDSKDKI